MAGSVEGAGREKRGIHFRRSKPKLRHRQGLTNLNLQIPQLTTRSLRAPLCAVIPRPSVLRRPFVVCLAIMFLSVMLPTERSAMPSNRDRGTWEKLTHHSTDLTLIHDGGFSKSTTAGRELPKDTGSWQADQWASRSIRALKREILPRAPSPTLPKSPWVGIIVLRV